MNIFILVLLTVTLIIHLFHSIQDANEEYNPKLAEGKKFPAKIKRKFTKPFLLIFIIIYYLISTKEINPVLIAALATSWFGDVLLMVPKMWGFVVGGVGFLFSHMLFIGVYVPQVEFSSIKWYFVLPVAFLYATSIFLLARSIGKHSQEGNNIDGKKKNKPLFIALIFYILFNASMNVFAFMQLLSNPCAGSVLAYIGAVLFFISDSTLFLCDFHPKKDIVYKRHFTVMLTYVVGEFLITQGILMLA